MALPVPAPPTAVYGAPSPATPSASPDLMGLLDSLIKPSVQPIYPPGYRKPKKPEVGEILKRAEQAKAAHQPFLDMVADTYRHVRLQQAGFLTPKDVIAREQGTQFPHISPRLLSNWNRFVGFLAARPRAYSVEVYDPSLQQNAQKIEDFAYHLRKYHERAWVRAGNMKLSQAEAKDLTFFGVIVRRATVDLRNPKCPIKAKLIDPATVFPQYGMVGAYEELEAVYRIYKTTASAAVAEWSDDGKIRAEVKKALGDRLESSGSDAEVEVCEYWDSWWGGAFLMGTDVALKPLTAHEYGCVPYIIQYGPGGEPMHTRSPDESFDPYSGRWGTGGTDAERIHKALGFMERQKRPNAQMEGLTTRYLESVIKGFNPPVIIERTIEAADRMDMPVLKRGEGEQTETAAGEENFKPVPESPKSGADAQTLLQIVMGDLERAELAPGFGDVPDKSNVSGTAQSIAAENGREQEAGWIESLEEFHGQSMTYDIKQYRNWGHLANYASGSRKSYYVPRRNPAIGQEPSFELTPEIIDAVDCDVTCSMQSLRMSDLPVFAQAAQMLGPEGPTPIWSLRDIARKAGVTDIERVMAENQTYMLLKRALEHPDLAKGITIPQALAQAVGQAEGNEQVQSFLLGQLKWWMENIAAPQQQQMQAQQQQPPQGPPGGPVQPGQGIAGGAGAPYQALGMGPGSQGAPVGAPPGPQGGPPPPPPGSFRIA